MFNNLENFVLRDCYVELLHPIISSITQNHYRATFYKGFTLNSDIPYHTTDI